MKNSIGTPQTLHQAIKNGADGNLTHDRIVTIENHVRDYLAQAFAAAILNSDNKTCTEMSALWEKITGRKVDHSAA